MTINERVRYIRKYFKLTGEQFGAKLGVTKNAISSVESGSRNVSNQLRSAILREFDISPDWFDNEFGGMFVDRSSTAIMADIINASIAVAPDEARKQLIARIDSLSDAEVLLWNELLKRKDGQR